MKKIVFLSPIIFLLLLLSSCSFIIPQRLEIHVERCEHGRIELKCIEKTLNSYDFEIYTYPDEGYYFDMDKSIFASRYPGASSGWTSIPRKIADNKYYISIATDYGKIFTITPVFSQEN